jgi:hypothetical protein
VELFRGLQRELAVEEGPLVIAFDAVLVLQRVRGETDVTGIALERMMMRGSACTSGPMRSSAISASALLIVMRSTVSSSAAVASAAS